MCPIENLCKGELSSDANPVALSANHGWSAVFTIPNHEKKVAEHCHYREIERFLPTYQCRRSWKNRQTVQLEIPLFPNYLFVRIPPERRATVLGIPGVLKVLGGHRGALTLPDPYISMLRTGTALRRILPHPGVTVGDRVQIVSGPMAGVEGFLTQVRAATRVVVSIELIRQSIAIEVARDEVIPVPFASGTRGRSHS